jgi:hypothetical protein
MRGLNHARGLGLALTLLLLQQGPTRPLVEEHRRGEGRIVRDVASVVSNGQAGYQRGRERKERGGEKLE